MKTKLLTILLLAGSTLFAQGPVYYAPPRPPVVVAVGPRYGWRPGYWTRPAYPGPYWGHRYYGRPYYRGYGRRW